MSEKTASITDDRLNNGDRSWWVDLGDQDGIGDQHQCQSLKEAKAVCRKHLLPEGGVILHFAHGGYELETTYDVKGTEYGD